MSKELIKKLAALKDINKRKLQEMTKKGDSVISKIKTKTIEDSKLLI